MKLEGNYAFKAPRQVIWELLLDPQVIAKIIPGCDELKAVGEDEYESKLTIGIAAVKGVYTSKISLSDKNPPESFRIKMQGKGARGFLNGDIAIRLEEQGDHTLLHYSAENQIGGAIAAVAITHHRRRAGDFKLHGAAETGALVSIAHHSLLSLIGRTAYGRTVCR
ncbi:carbon monoxide dehydrogenase subunit G [candidate division KSB1 bacterium]|nr:carbon monoxide dehydrogenase subunit G [candidate division KSB1 bacterium]